MPFVPAGMELWELRMHCASSKDASSKDTGSDHLNS